MARNCAGVGGGRFRPWRARTDTPPTPKTSAQRPCIGGAFMIRHAISNLNAWLAILAVVLSSSAGAVLLSRALKQMGDLGQLRARRGSVFVTILVLRNRYFLPVLECMAIKYVR